MNVYTRKVQYYETDRMNFVHHSNYIRWFEEGRVDYLEKEGLSYAFLEASGYLSPVLQADCRFHRSCTFGDTVKITTALVSFDRVRFSFSYRVVNPATGELLATGSTTHCFLDREGRPISLWRADAALAERFARLCRADCQTMAQADRR